MDKFGSKNGFLQSSNSNNVTGNLNNRRIPNFGSGKGTLKETRTNNSRGKLPLKPSNKTLEQDTQDSLRMLKSKGSMNSEQQTYSNRVSSMSKMNHENLKINTNIMPSKQNSYKVNNLNFDERNDYNNKGMLNNDNFSSKTNLNNKINTRLNNNSGLNNIGIGNKITAKDSNAFEMKSGIPYNTNQSRAKSSTKISASKPTSKINKNNLNPMFNPSSKVFNNTRGDEDDRPIITNKSKFKMESASQEELIPCKDCGRNFREEALLKHIKICKKVFKSKRKKFDSKKKRIIDSEHAMLLRQADKAENNPKLKQVRAKKKENWKIQSDILRSAARASRQMPINNRGGYQSKGVSLNNGYKGTGITQGNYNKKGIVSMNNGYNYGNSNIGKNNCNPGVTPSYPSDLTLCNTCGRRYNDEAYEKHLAGCQRRNKESLIKNKLGKPTINNKMKK